MKDYELASLLITKTRSNICNDINNYLSNQKQGPVPSKILDKLGDQISYHNTKGLERYEGSGRLATVERDAITICVHAAKLMALNHQEDCPQVIRDSCFREVKDSLDILIQGLIEKFYICAEKESQEYLKALADVQP